MHEVSALGLRRRGVGAEGRGDLAAPPLSRCALAAVLACALAFVAGPVALAAGSSPTALPDGSPTQAAKLAHPDIAAGDQFGYCVAVSGDTALVGAYLEEGAAGSDSGAVHVFVKGPSGWTEEATLTAPDPRSYAWFGWSVALDGDTAAVGSRYGGGQTGSAGLVNVFVRSAGTWAHEATLAPQGGAPSDVFGYSVGVSGDTAIVGAPWSDLEADDAGAAYVFTRSGPAWSPDATLLANDAGMGDRLGWSVAVSGEAALAGAPWHDHNEPDAGAAYAFRRHGGAWSGPNELGYPLLGPDDRFGFSVALSDPVAAVGVPLSDDGGTDVGAAHVYKRDGWTWSRVARLVPAAGAVGDWFGYSVGVSGENVVVGAPWHDGPGSHSGLAYSFAREGASWRQAPLEPAGLAAGDWLGRSVGVSGNNAVVGAFGDDAGGAGAGAGYVFAGLAPYAVEEDTTLTVPAPGVLGNDSDPEGDTLSAVIEVAPERGDLALAPDGSFRYVPDEDYFGEDAFTYRASDGESLSSPATVTVSVLGVNDPPVLGAEPQVYEGDVQGGYGGALWGVTLTDVDDETSTVTLENDAPSPLPLGHAAVRWTATDPHGATGTVDQSVTVTDTTPPTDPAVWSTSHSIAVTSPATSVDLAFEGAADACAGVRGYSVSWSAGVTETPDGIEDLGVAAAVTSSPELADGAWWFNLRTVDGAGNWSAGRHLGPFFIRRPTPTALTISRGTVSVVPYARTVTFSGRLTSEGLAVAGRKVSLERRVFGTNAWLQSGDATTDASGAWARAVKLSQNTYWRALFAGDASYLPTISPAVWVKAKASLPAPTTAPTVVYRNRTFTLRGYVYPAHPGKTRVYLYQYVGRRLVARGYRYATNTRLTGRSRYVVALRLAAGRWVVRAYHADTDHYPTWGTSRVVTVR